MKINWYNEDEEFQPGLEHRPTLLVGDMNGYDESNASRTSTGEPNGSSVALQPLHIPAKRLTPTAGNLAYPPSDCADTVRHGNGQWGGYSPDGHSAFLDAHPIPQYSPQPGYYYNTIDRKPPQTSSIKFWPNSYEAGPSTVTPVPADACQSFAPQTWCNYSPYTGTRGHMEPHTPQPVSYFPTVEDRSRVPSAMDSYPQTDAYGLRTFPTDVHCPTTFVQSGSENLLHEIHPGELLLATKPFTQFACLGNICLSALLIPLLQAFRPSIFPALVGHPASLQSFPASNPATMS